MTGFFSYPEGSILIRLLIAHCLTDFILQPGHWVEHKEKKLWKSPYLWYHGLITGIVAWVLLWHLDAWWMIIMITITHIIIDGLKIRLSKTPDINTRKEFLLFAGDQFLHVFIILLLWLSYISGWQRINNTIIELFTDYRLLLRLLGYLLMIGPVGYFIHFVTKRWANDLNPEDSLKNAGKWIGILERVLIITFIYADRFEAIGFLIAAKSLLRVTDKPEIPGAQPGQARPFSSRKHTEYVLIGTFLSFAIAIISGLIINRLLMIL